MDNCVKSFAELTPQLQSLAGGKGSMLANMYQDGYPVPEGFIILTTAFQENGHLDEDAKSQIKDYLACIRNHNDDATFAVRSSAISEDSSIASFAGEFDTVLNCSSDQEIWAAIQTVYQSKESERVQLYSNVQGIDQFHQIAIVIQLMVNPELSGVLFTADPITGSYEYMVGNYVYGLGEQLVSGEVNAIPFQISRPKGKYNGAIQLRKYVRKIFKLAIKLEKKFQCPQDIEWAVAKGKCYILQSRPITTLSPGNPDTYEWNYSMTGDYLWTNANVGEAVPDVVTPFTWSIMRLLDEEINVVPGYYLISGLICGRIYTNISRRLSVFAAFGVKPERGYRLLSDIFGQMPEGTTIPVYPFSRLALLKTVLPRVKRYLQITRRVSKDMQQQIAVTPETCEKLKKKIADCTTSNNLLVIWKNELEPFYIAAWWRLLTGGTKSVVSMQLKKKLTKLVGEEDANILLSNLRGNSQLESLGPIIGISKVIKGAMTKEEYRGRYGHRGAYEFELSIPDPSEDRNWLDKQMEESKQMDIDVEFLLTRQKAQFEDAVKRFKERFRLKSRWLDEQLTLAAEGAQFRETVRSEFVRSFRILRTFTQKVGEITGIADDVYFLYRNELLDLLSGDDKVLRFIPLRKGTFQKYKELPPFPAIIRGRFDPFKWSLDQNRRGDLYDPTISITPADSITTLKGFAGAAGRVEGKVRILSRPEEGEQLLPGEILVAMTTNIGWTPIFPKAAAIITDVGAPLSHAAIVARELGIPAVVGCGNATTRLKTGDRVIVDGGQGIVHILNSMEI